MFRNCWDKLTLLCIYNHRSTYILLLCIVTDCYSYSKKRKSALSLPWQNSKLLKLRKQRGGEIKLCCDSYLSTARMYIRVRFSKSASINITEIIVIRISLLIVDFVNLEYTGCVESLPGTRRWAVHSQFNTNSVETNKCACAATQSSPFPGHTATLLVAYNKI